MATLGPHFHVVHVSGLKRQLCLNEKICPTLRLRVRGYLVTPSLAHSLRFWPVYTAKLATSVLN